MKKTAAILTVMMLLLFPLAAKAQGAGDLSRVKVNTLVNSFNGVDGVEIVHIGWFGMSLVKMVAGAASLSDAESREAVKLIKGVKSLTVMDFEDASPAVKARISRKASGLFNQKNLLLEAVDEGEKTCIYGDISPDGGKVRNFAVYSPESGTLVCLFGSFDVDKVMKYLDKD